MFYVVQGTSAGGQTVVYRETAEGAYDTAREMQVAGYADISVRDPGGTCHLGDELRNLLIRRAA